MHSSVPNQNGRNTCEAWIDQTAARKMQQRNKAHPIDKFVKYFNF